jgi:hypothetical protein
MPVANMWSLLQTLLESVTQFHIANFEYVVINK